MMTSLSDCDAPSKVFETRCTLDDVVLSQDYGMPQGATADGAAIG